MSIFLLSDLPQLNQQLPHGNSNATGCNGQSSGRAIIAKRKQSMPIQFTKPNKECQNEVDDEIVRELKMGEEKISCARPDVFRTKCRIVSFSVQFFASLFSVQSACVFTVHTHSIRSSYCNEIKSTQIEQKGICNSIEFRFRVIRE